jgi:hypothetical protein
VTALGVHGDPDGWQHAGYTIATVVSQLADELDTADARGGSGLRPYWSGPVAEAHQDLWSRRHGRYGDMIYQAGRAANALIDFGERLADFQRRASDLERHWLGAGLHLTADGTWFMLPSGYESLVHEAQAMLHGLLRESETDIKAMWADVTAAVEDLVTVLESVLTALADFELLELSVLGAAASWVWDQEVKDPTGLLHGTIDSLNASLYRTAVGALDSAYAIVMAAGKDGSRGMQEAADIATRDAVSAADVAVKFDRFAKIGGPVLTLIGVGITARKTWLDHDKRGWVNAIEDNAGDLTSTGLGLAVGAVLGTAVVAGAVASAPVWVPVGIAVGAGLVCVGVGDVVQHEVNHHRAGTTRVLNDIGHGVEHAAVWGGTETGLIPESAS